VVQTDRCFLGVSRKSILNVLGLKQKALSVPGGKSFPREVVNILWDLPALPDSGDPVTFQNMGLENILHLVSEKEQKHIAAVL
jgi:hypothetical protein